LADVDILYRRRVYGVCLFAAMTSLAGYLAMMLNNRLLKIFEPQKQLPPRNARTKETPANRTRPNKIRPCNPYGLDATTEALRRAAEDTPSGASPDDVERVSVCVPKIRFGVDAASGRRKLAS
jgi:hypothetical protein